jgi:hypothetical protein
MDELSPVKESLLAVPRHTMHLQPMQPQSDVMIRDGISGVQLTGVVGGAVCSSRAFLINILK